MVYDQRSRKVLRFSSLGDYIEEFTLQAWEKGTLTEIYELDENHLLTVYRSFEYLRNLDLEPEAYLVIFDKKTEQYTHSATISDRPFARNIVDDHVFALLEPIKL